MQCDFVGQGKLYLGFILGTGQAWVNGHGEEAPNWIFRSNGAGERPAGMRLRSRGGCRSCGRHPDRQVCRETINPAYVVLEGQQTYGCH